MQTAVILVAYGMAARWARGTVYWSINIDKQRASSSSSCGNMQGKCVNHWKCKQRQGRYGGECYSDLKDLRR